MESVDMQEAQMELPGSPDFPIVTDIWEVDGFSNLNVAQKKQALTQWKIGMAKDEMTQLIDRIASNHFQG